MLGVEFGYLGATCVVGLTSILLLYWYSIRNNDFWKKRGVPYIEIVPFFRALLEMGKKSMHDIEIERYKKYGIIDGYFEFNKPNLSVSDPDLIRDILVKDFPTFNSRRLIATGNEIFDKMVSVMKGDEDWKRIRSIITPTFTTGKIKKMMSILKDCSSTVVKNFKELSAKSQYIDGKRLYGAFAMDVIASSAFSTKIDSHNDPNNRFVQNASRVFNQKINWKVFAFYLSMNELVSQCVIFFIAGYDTTASTLSFATYLLALNPEVQNKVRQEVDEAIKDADGELMYETVQKMKYLDNIISETLRMYPPLIRNERTVDSPYKLGTTGIRLHKGMIVSIPIYAIHRDPKHFPNPDQFDPERFNPEERAKRHPYTYLPFGAGPRNCVAMRFALLEVKVCLAHVIANFNIKTCPETKVPLDFALGQMLLQPKGIILEMETRKDSPLLK